MELQAGIPTPLNQFLYNVLNTLLMEWQAPINTLPLSRHPKNVQQNRQVIKNDHVRVDG
jgi:hypothetical protein